MEAFVDTNQVSSFREFFIRVQVPLNSSLLLLLVLRLRLSISETFHVLIQVFNSWLILFLELFFIQGLTWKISETNGTLANYRVIVFSEHFSDILVNLKQISIVIIGLSFFLSLLVKHDGKSSLQLIKLLLLKALLCDKYDFRCLERILLTEGKLSVSQQSILGFVNANSWSDV